MTSAPPRFSAFYTVSQAGLAALSVAALLGLSACGTVPASGPPQSQTAPKILSVTKRDGMGVPQLCARLYDELVAERGEVDNFASFLRVCCGRYLALQLSGGIPQDASIPIGSLNAQQVLATEGQTQGVVPRLARCA